MTAIFNLRASNNATFRWTRDLSEYAAVYDLTMTVIRMQMRRTPVDPDPPAYEWCSNNSSHGQAVYNPTTKLVGFGAPEATTLDHAAHTTRRLPS